VELFVLYHSHERNNSEPSVGDMSTLVVISQEILRTTVCTATLLLMAFQFFANLLCCLLQRVCAAVAEMSVLGDLHGRIRTGHRHAPGSLSSLLVDVDVARH
jgi:hypothetical protein